MLELLQQENNLIGSKQAIEELSHKKHARILVISDSHGNYQFFSKIVRRFGPDCDGLIFCGDGARDVAELLNMARGDEDFRKSIPSVFAIVRGNGDAGAVSVDFEIRKDNPAAENHSKRSLFIPLKQTLTVNGTNLFITHGHYEGVDYGYDQLGLQLQFLNCKAGLHGHTHIPVDHNENEYKIINPGSISRPRGGMPATFAILTVEESFMDAAFVKIKDSFDDDDSYQVLNLIM